MVERGPHQELIHPPEIKYPQSFIKWAEEEIHGMDSNPHPGKIMRAARFARQYASQLENQKHSYLILKDRYHYDYVRKKYWGMQIRYLLRSLKEKKLDAENPRPYRTMNDVKETKNTTLSELRLMKQIAHDFLWNGSYDRLKQQIDRLQDACETSKPLKKETEPKLDAEHVLYGNYTVVPDTHSVDPEEYGITEESKNVISMGDVLDKKSSKVNTLKRDAKKAIETWTKLLESGRGQMIIGNHEFFMLSGVIGKSKDDFLVWMNSGGDWTLEQLGINPYRFLVKKTDKYGTRYQMTDDQYNVILQEIQANETLVNFAKQLIQKGKLYLIVNEVVLQHAGLPLSAEGALTSIRRKRVFVSDYEGMRGFDSYDALEKKIREGDPRVLHMLATASSKDRSPSTMRGSFYDVMAKPETAQRAIHESDIQSWNRGAGGCHFMVVGHEISIGGKEIGPYLKGADTGRCNPMKFSISEDGRNATVASTHNFGRSEPLMYQLKKPMEPTQPPPSPSGIR